MTEHLPLLIVLAPLLGAVFAALTTWFWPRLSFPFVLTGLAVSCLSAVMLVFELPTDEDGVISYQLGGWGAKGKYDIVGIQITVDYLNGLILAAGSSM